MYSAGAIKDAIALCAFATVQTKLSEIQIVHTDRGNEFKNNLIEETLKTFKIKRSFSMKECPHANAVAEATFKIIKTEFVYGECFETLNE